MNKVSLTTRAMRGLFFVTLVLGIATLVHEANFLVQGLNASPRWLTICSILLQIAGVAQLAQTGYVQDVLGKTIFKPKYRVSNLPLASAQPSENSARSAPAWLRDTVYCNALTGFILIGISASVRLYTTFL